MSIIYTSKRIGQYGVPFNFYKFRTMIENADKLGGSSTSDDDSRITKIGRILRKTKLDELPQLWNWFKGDIKLIGWRPEATEYLHTFSPEILATKPGILGLGIFGDFDEGAILKGSLDPDKDYVEKILPEKRKLELAYVNNKSFILDLKIIFSIFIRLCGIRRSVQPKWLPKIV